MQEHKKNLIHEIIKNQYSIDDLNVTSEETPPSNEIFYTLTDRRSCISFLTELNNKKLYINYSNDNEATLDRIGISERDLLRPEHINNLCRKIQSALLNSDPTSSHIVGGRP